MINYIKSLRIILIIYQSKYLFVKLLILRTDCPDIIKMFKKQQLTEDIKPQIFNSPSISSSKNIISSSNNPSNQKKAKLQNQQNLTQQNFDVRRLKRAVYQFESKDESPQQRVPQRRQAVKMNVFRQSAREQQRQFHQQNHEYLRMYSVIAQSALNGDKFRIKDNREGNKGQLKGQNKTSNLQQNFATVHLQLQMQLTSSLIGYKFPVRETYNIVPFKRQSIQIECRQLLDPKFQFFVFEKYTNKIEKVRHDLANLLEQGLATEFKSLVLRTVNYLDFFNYLDLVNYREQNNSLRSNSVQYPRQILQIAEQNQIFQLNSDEEEFYTRGEIKVLNQQTNERIVTCEEFDLQETAPSIYFEMTNEYTLYKKYREIQFKFLKIYDKDITINTDIRNIISSQKIYLIELMKETDLYIDLSTHLADYHAMKEINNQLRRKCEQFLKVLCNYTESKILKHYNIENYHEKIMIFIQKSIKYNKEIENIDPNLLDEFPILKIWYEIPKYLFGYTRETLHCKYYDLVRAMLVYEEKIKDYQLQKQLSIKRPNVKYPEL